MDVRSQGRGRRRPNGASHVLVVRRSVLDTIIQEHGGDPLSFRAIQITLATITLVIVAVPIVEITAQIDVPDGPADERMAAYRDIPILRCGIPDKLERFLAPEDPEVVRIATALAGAPEPYMAALKHVYANTTYVSDADRDHWQFPAETIYSGTGDCEDMALLLTSICRALGYDAVLITVPGHVASAVRMDGELIIMEPTAGITSTYNEYHIVGCTAIYIMMYVGWPIIGTVLALLLIMDVGSPSSRGVYVRHEAQPEAI